MKNEKFGDIIKNGNEREKNGRSRQNTRIGRRRVILGTEQSYLIGRGKIYDGSSERAI